MYIYIYKCIYITLFIDTNVNCYSTYMYTKIVRYKKSRCVSIEDHRFSMMK